MKATKPVFKINADGSLVQYNERLGRWELTSRAWQWSDIDPEHIEESKQNWKRYKKSIGEDEEEN